MREHEGRFTDDLSQAIEYSIGEKEGTRLLRIRTGQGRTVTSEPLATGVKSVFDVEWHLKAFVSVGQRDSDVELPRVTRLIPRTEVTAGFGDDGVGGRRAAIVTLRSRIREAT